MKTKEALFTELNIFAQCKRYGLPFWQCPHSLFLVMGITIIGVVLISYAIGLRYIEDPQIIALIVLFLTAVLFIITFFITQSFEKIAEANRLKTEFVNIVSHQLRTPLTSLSWAIEALISGKFGKVEEKQLEYLKILKENNIRMKELIENLITVSKIEGESRFFKKEKVFLEKIIQDLILESQPSIDASKVEIKFKFDKNLPEVFTDSRQIKIVIENLLSNAIRYIPNYQLLKMSGKEKGIIEIYLSKKEDNIYFGIKDNGTGIPEEDQKYIFQRFFRSKNVKELQPYGSGLGLFITKSILNRLGGKIGFQSKENKGTTFWFTLPIK